jgi:hypothetical protein
VRDGLELGRADFKPEDKTITLAEWLAYGVERVPKLYELVKSGKAGSVLEKGTQLLITGTARPIQQPSLFDFSRKRHDVALMKK